MYASFFGLRQAPFSIAPDPHYLYMSERHREALAHLLYGLGSGGGFVLLSGEIGAGKTTVCRCFLEQIPPHNNVAYIFNPKLTATELLQSICDEFHIPVPPAAQTIKDYLDPLNAFLLAAHATGQNNVLIIDEAQNLSPGVLEQLRLLTNLETAERKLLQIILIGQPELRSMLARPELEQLAQRVIARFHLEALSETETGHYVRHRLAVAGLSGPLPFDAAALRCIHRISRGVPRRINLLCDRALLGAFAHGQAQAGADIVQQAAREVFDDKPPGEAQRGAGTATAPSRWSAALSVAGLFGVGFGVWSLLVAGGPARLARTGDAALPAGLPIASSAASAPASAPVSTPAALAAAATNVTGPAGIGTAPAPSTALPAAVAAANGASVPVSSAKSGATSEAASQRPPLSPVELSAALATPADRQREAWRGLGQAWAFELADSGDPCGQTARLGLACFRSPVGSLALIRQLDRPVVLTLHAPATTAAPASTAPLLLLGLDDSGARVLLDGHLRAMPLATLASAWRGEFLTLWRSPPGYPGTSAAGAAVLNDWLRQQLRPAARQDASASAASAAGADSAGGAVDTQAAGWVQRVQAFQVAQGLQPDGRTGPITFMHLNRVAGVAEPRLQAGTAARPGPPPPSR